MNEIKDNSKIGEFILNDIKKQGESFKERLLQRRKKNNQDNIESKPNSNEKNKTDEVGNNIFKPTSLVNKAKQTNDEDVVKKLFNSEIKCSVDEESNNENKN